MTDLVPEDFDLESARNAHSTTDPSERKRCPECHRASVLPKVAKPSGIREHDADYLCQYCGHHFDEPVYGDPNE